MNRLALLLPALLLLSACASSAPATVATDSDEPRTGSVVVQRTQNEDSERLEAIYRARIDSSRQNYVQANVDFMTGMIAHHAQALIMSRLAPENEASTAVQTLAARIINAQNDEIALMQRWLERRGEPVPEVHIDGLNLMIHGVGEHHHHMPGMLTQAQLEELAAATGEEFDRLYLRYMIQHHEGAVGMVTKLFAEDGVAQDEDTFRLASDINVDQQTEIKRMKLMLSALEGSTSDQ